MTAKAIKIPSLVPNPQKNRQDRAVPTDDGKDSDGDGPSVGEMTEKGITGY